MLIVSTNPAQVVLEAVALGLGGAAKLDVVSGLVRVYHLAGVTETVDLPSTSLVQVGVTNVWRYVWSGPTLPAGAYVVEYKLTDGNGVVGMMGEDLVVQPTLNSLVSDVSLLRKIETNRWKLDKNTLQMIMYDDDQVTPLLKFNLFDRNGAPNVEEVFERTQAP